jgi:hypothetical protein
MIDQLTLSEFESEIEGNYTDIIEYLYRQELNNLLERGQLRLASNVNIVLFTDDAEQARMGDIIVGNVHVKLRAIAKQLGRLRG